MNHAKLFPIALIAALASPVHASEDHDRGEHAHEEEHAHESEFDDHLAELDGVRFVHFWAAEPEAGVALIHGEIENRREVDLPLEGVEASFAEAIEWVGRRFSGGEVEFVTLRGLEAPAGGALELSPEGAALRASGLSSALREGDEASLTFEIDGEKVEVIVEILEAGATRHPHAGHAH